MKLPSEIRFVDAELKAAFLKLKNGDDSERWLFKVINQAMDNIEKNAFSGVQLAKRLIPKRYSAKKDISNLWKYDLPQGWRLIYSIRTEEIIVVSVILEWFDHKEYEKRFSY